MLQQENQWPSLNRVSMGRTTNENVAKEREETLKETQDKKIKVVGLSKRYKNVEALGGVTFNVPEATHFGLVGPNGAGKSTLFNIILGKTMKSSGDLAVKGSEAYAGPGEMLVKDNPYVGNNFGAAFQTETVWDEMSVKDNLKFYADLHRVDKAGLSELLVYFEFEHYLEKTAAELSSGNRRKLCVIVALLGRPNVLLFDEATTGVDLGMRLKLKRIFEYLRSRHRLATVFTTHFLKDVELFCDKLGIIDGGRFLFVDFLDNIRHDFGGYLLDLRLADPALLDALPARTAGLCALALVRADPADRSATLRATRVTDLFELFLLLHDLQSAGQLLQFALHQLSVEDIYVGVFQNKLT